MLHDADCGFCARIAAQVHRLGVVVEDRALQSVDLPALGVDTLRAEHEMPAVDADGRVHYGHRAWASILATGAPPWQLVGWLMTHRPTEALARAAYGWVSTHRDRLPGGTPACATTGAPQRRTW